MGLPPANCEMCKKPNTTLVGMNGHWYCVKCFAKACEQVGSAVRRGIAAMTRPRPAVQP